MTRPTAWFSVDKTGLAKLLDRRGKAFAVCELIQNAWDTEATRVDVTIQHEAVRRTATVLVEDDDPAGFKNLADSFTLFAESTRKSDPLKRGRFNLGEKLVLALCREARISSTTGTVLFGPRGRRRSPLRREHGSAFLGIVPMTTAEHEAALVALGSLIPPSKTTTTINGTEIPARTPLATAKATLETEVADDEGVMRRRWRETTLSIYEPLDGEAASVYEMGIPVVATGDRYSVDVAQKVPLGFDRDNLPYAYLRDVRVAVLNEMASRLEKADANAPWVRDAAGDADVSNAAVARVMDLRFGAERVIYDPSDQEANAIAVTRGYTVIHGGMLAADEWENVWRAGAALPAGKVTPSPKPFSPDGSPLVRLPEEEWTDGIRRVVDFAKEAARELLRTELAVTIADDRGWGFRASYGKGALTLNLNRLGRSWFDGWPHADGIKLLIHEFAHEFEPNHLSEAYHETLCRLGSEFTFLAARRPKLFAPRAPDDDIPF